MRVDAKDLTDLEQEYYVIVGCGFSAVTNHAILARQPAGRLGALPILHIGGTDPWRSYFPMPMGQWPTLLSLPGFGSRPSSILRTDNLYSIDDCDFGQAKRPYRPVKCALRRQRFIHTDCLHRRIFIFGCGMQEHRFHVAPESLARYGALHQPG